MPPLNQGIGMAVGGIIGGSKAAGQGHARWAHLEGLGKSVHWHKVPSFSPCPELLQKKSVVIICLASVHRNVEPAVVPENRQLSIENK